MTHQEQKRPDVLADAEPRDGTSGDGASVPPLRLPATYLVFWPGCGDDYLTRDTELEARMAADFAARIYGSAEVYVNRRGRTRRVARVTREEIRAAEEAARADVLAGRDAA